MQLGTVYRDRIDNIEGYRRSFKQILLGTWGSNNSFYDIEILENSISVLKDLYPNAKLMFEISNHKIFEQYYQGCAENVRFNNLTVLKDKIDLQEYNALFELFEKKG